MIQEWAAALESAALATALRNSVWSYPLVNAGHIFGVALLVGSIVPLDLRILGAWRSAPLAPLWIVLTRTAGAGLVLAITFGTLLFITRATEYISSSLFIAKMVIVALGTANILGLRMLSARQPANTTPPHEHTPTRLRLAAGLSLAAWLTALILGRLVGYF